MKSASDLAQLARRAALGEKDAGDVLMRELSPAIVRTARLVVGPGSSVAEDAAQEAVIDVSRAIGTLREPEAVVGWAIRITVARAIKVSRRERLKSRIWPQAASELADQFDLSATAAVIREEFYRLPPKLRAVAVLRLYLDFSEADTARALGCSIGTVKSQLSRARDRLAERLEGHGVTPSVSRRAAKSEGGRK